MKTVLSPFLVILSISILFVSCDFVTEITEDPLPPGARKFMINEVMTLPLNHPNTHTWVEFLNNSPDTVSLTDVALLRGWTLSFSTARLYHAPVIGLDSVGNPLVQTFRDSIVSFATERYDVPFGEGLFVVPGEEAAVVRIPPGGLFTIVNDEDRMKTFTEWGPGDTRYAREREFFQGAIDSVVIVSTADTGLVRTRVRFYYGEFLFHIEPGENLVLKNPAGEEVDRVQLNAFSVPAYESVARYAGGYSTGNSAQDFYVTNKPAIIPTPHWYNPRYRR